jgi:hypothetical protein
LPMAIPCKPIRSEWRSSSNLDTQEPLWFIVFPMAISCQSSWGGKKILKSSYLDNRFPCSHRSKSPISKHKQLESHHFRMQLQKRWKEMYIFFKSLIV